MPRARRPKVDPTWWKAACLRRFGLAKQRPPTMPKPAPLWAIDDWAAFIRWSTWMDAGARAPRPGDVWTHAQVPEWARWLRKKLVAHRQAGKPPVKREPATPEAKPLAPSLVFPHPLILTASDPDHANGWPELAEGSIGRIIVPGVAPLWEIRKGNRPDGQVVGYLAQIEGEGQTATAFEFRTRYPAPEPFGIVGTGGTDPHAMIEHPAGRVTTYLVELNGQAALEPYANTEHMTWQLEHEGWPDVHPCYGCYVPMGLQDYAAYDPLVWRNGKQQRLGHAQGLEVPGAVFSAEGSQDTDSRPTIAIWARQ